MADVQTFMILLQQTWFYDRDGHNESEGRQYVFHLD